MTHAPFDPPRAERTLAVVVHYGDPSLTMECLRAVAAGTTRPGMLALVDNGPSAFPEQWLDGLNLRRQLIVPPRNVGFAAAVNLAIASGPGFEHVWLLNNDATPAEAAFEELLAAAVRSGRPALVSSLIEDGGGGPWFERARFYPWRLESKHVAVARPVEPDDVDPGRPTPRSIPYMPACSLLVPLNGTVAKPLLDQRFFVYGEDIDLANRASAAGWPLILARRSVVRHQPSSSTSADARERLIAEGSVRLVADAYPWLVPVALAGGTILGMLRSLLERRPTLLVQRLRGYVDGLRARLSAQGRRSAR